MSTKHCAACSTLATLASKETIKLDTLKGIDAKHSIIATSKPRQVNKMESFIDDCNSAINACCGV